LDCERPLAPFSLLPEIGLDLPVQCEVDECDEFAKPVRATAFASALLARPRWLE
jgi:hypothetical protein